MNNVDCLSSYQKMDDMSGTKWKELFLSVANSHAPMKRKRIRNKKSPWITINLRKLMVKRDELKQKPIVNNSPNDWKEFKIRKNIVNNEIKKAKKSYYDNHFAQI